MREDQWVTDYRDRDICGNCHGPLEAGDKYCRLCGTKRGEGTFEPFRNLMQCIYGPEPVKRQHLCRRCGYRWETVLMIDDERYCPRCGGPVEITEEDDPDGVSFDEL